AICDGSASSHEPVQQALQFSGWVGGEAAVHGTRLDDGAARGLEEAEPDAEVLACDLAERGVAAADACHELEPPAHGGPVDARVESGQAQLVDLPRGVEETGLLAVEDDAHVDEL